ncbi:MAG: Hsp20/alpha crystallin family protein [Truepera sp.]|nr:Hsp20/alpha crystallin family protein [Truepera sp.]
MALVRVQSGRPVPVRGWDLANAGVGSLFGEFDRLFNEMAAPLLNVGSTLGATFNAYPADLYETGEAVVLEMAVPGIKADDLDIRIEGRQLTIRGTIPNITDNEDRRYWLQGVPRGEFSRSVTLPATVVIDRVAAKVTDGMLTLTMPKVPEAQAKRIAITQG